MHVCVCMCLRICVCVCVYVLFFVLFCMFALFSDLDSQLQNNPSLLDEVLGQGSPSNHDPPRMEHYHSYSSVVVTRRPDGVSVLHGRTGSPIFK